MLLTCGVEELHWELIVRFYTNGLPFKWYFYSRDAFQQVELGTTLSFIEEAEPEIWLLTILKELLFMGLILRNNYSSCFRNSKNRQNRSAGIFHKQLGEHTHKLRLIKQIFQRLVRLKLIA